MVSKRKGYADRVMAVVALGRLIQLLSKQIEPIQVILELEENETDREILQKHLYELIPMIQGYQTVYDEKVMALAREEEKKDPTGLKIKSVEVESVEILSKQDLADKVRITAVVPETTIDKLKPVRKAKFKKAIPENLAPIVIPDSLDKK